MKTFRIYMIVGAASVIAVALLLFFTSTGALDTIGARAVTAFREAIDAMPQLVSGGKEEGSWSITATDASARFSFRSVFNATEGYDLSFAIDPSPFLAAGLDIALLPEAMVSEGDIVIGANMVGGAAGDSKEAAADPVDTFKRILESERSRIKYHADLDHFGISLGNGNMFEFARDIDTNDKDIVFVLDPAPFIKAGVDTANVQGWIAAKIKVLDSSGRMVLADKLVKPINI